MNPWEKLKGYLIVLADVPGDAAEREQGQAAAARKLLELTPYIEHTEPTTMGRIARLLGELEALWDYDPSCAWVGGFQEALAEIQDYAKECQNMREVIQPKGGVPLWVRKAVLVFAVMVTAGCGRESFIEPEVRPFVSRFLEEGKKRGVEVDTTNIVVITDASLADGLGSCRKPLFGTPTIRLKPVWKKFDEFGKESLIFHELGHCLLGLGHDHGGLMSRFLVGRFYRKKRDWYLDQLFLPKNP